MASVTYPRRERRAAITDPIIRINLLEDDMDEGESVTTDGFSKLHAEIADLKRTLRNATVSTFLLLVGLSLNLLLGIGVFHK